MSTYHFFSYYHNLKQFIKIVIILCVPFFVGSCKKTETVQLNIEGAWQLYAYVHNGKEIWHFTKDNKLYITLDLPAENIHGDTVNQGSYTLDIKKYAHGSFLKKNLFNVPNITFEGLNNFKYGQKNIDFTPINTIWEIHKLEKNILFLITDQESGIPGGLVTKEFFRE